MNNVIFVTGTSEIYHLAGNDWYAVEQDDEKVMLVDTDGCISDEVLRTPWTYAESFINEDANSGQCILDYVNSMTDKHFSSIKHAIIPQDVDCVNEYGEGQGKLKNAYMWDMSSDEFESHKDIGGAIFKNTNAWVWTRTFNERWNGYNYAWYVYSSSGNLNICGVTNSFAVAPAFYLSKSAIDYIAKDGEIILKPSTNTKLTQSDAETLDMNEFYKKHFNNLNITEVAQISKSYQIYCTAEYVSENYPEINEKRCIELAYKVRERMDKYDCSESDAINEVLSQL